MTKQKKHKQRVRALATETGQRYTDALVNRQTADTEDSLEAARKLLDHPWPEVTEEEIAFLSSNAFRTGRYKTVIDVLEQAAGVPSRPVSMRTIHGEWVYNMTAMTLAGKNWVGLANAINELAEGLGTPVAHPAVAKALGITPANVPWFEIWVLKGQATHTIYLVGKRTKTINPRPFRLKDNSPRPTDRDAILAEQLADQKVHEFGECIGVEHRRPVEPIRSESHDLDEPFDLHGSDEYLTDHLAVMGGFPTPENIDGIDPKLRGVLERARSSGLHVMADYDLYLRTFRPDIDDERRTRILESAQARKAEAEAKLHTLIDQWPDQHNDVPYSDHEGRWYPLADLWRKP